ncbi:hypothetical protein Airi02_019400 [Actinoallomurus iriomotensis]|uniref:Uncharacterized protein n=1 Tax=Actinoallomurus iriomotensis TaxID=478107 RepID=A0A9W6RWJ8_9ACTN|nr:hypothetical protein Airi02_019400 [Actinoallomurus iriomotensis]
MGYRRPAGPGGRWPNWQQRWGQGRLPQIYGKQTHAATAPGRPQTRETTGVGSREPGRRRAQLATVVRTVGGTAGLRGTDSSSHGPSYHGRGKVRSRKVWSWKVQARKAAGPESTGRGDHGPG